MSVSDGSKRPSFLETMKASLSPREPLKVDKDAPNPLPRTVKVAGWIAVVAGIITFGLGVLTQAQSGTYVDAVRDKVNECKGSVGLGDAVAATDTSDLATVCKTLADYTQEQYDGASTQLLINFIVLAVLGLVAAWAGWGLTRGARWARRLATGVGVVLVAGTFLNVFVIQLVLIPAVLMLVAVVLTYMGKGATYFLRAKAQGAR